MTKAVTFNASIIGIPQDSEGAARLVSHIAKPTNHSIAMRKLRDLVLLFEGERPFNNRSRDQVKDAASVVWSQIRKAIELGDWFDRMFAASPAGRVDDLQMQGYARTLTQSLTGADKKIIWQPHLPVIHMAAGFRIAMMRTNRGRFFDANATPRSVRIEQLREVLWDDHQWVSLALEQAEARLVTHRLHGRQVPGKTRIFIRVPSSQE